MRGWCDPVCLGSIPGALTSGDAEQMTGSPKEAMKGKKNTRKYNSESKADVIVEAQYTRCAVSGSP